MFRQPMGPLRGLLVIGLLMVVSLLVYSSAVNAEQTATRTPDWPPFTMTYEVVGSFSGMDGPRQRVAYRLTYDNRCAWSKEVIASVAAPESVGTVYAFDGSRLVIREPLTPNPIVRPSETEGGLVVPERWLVPGSDVLLVENRGYRMVFHDDAAHRLIIRRDDAIPCAGDAESVGNIEPQACASAASWVSTEIIVYRTDVTPSLPIEVSSLVNDDEVGRISVTELTIFQ